jgi:hypothetical protein
MTAQELLMLVLDDGPAIWEQLQKEKDPSGFAGWMKGELQALLEHDGFQVQIDVAYDALTLDLLVTLPKAEPPQHYAIDLVTETDVAGTMAALQAAATRLRQYPAEGCTARWAVGVGFSKAVWEVFGQFVADPKNHSRCGEYLDTAISALVVTVPAPASKA